jgi:hypothetical protein
MPMSDLMVMGDEESLSTEIFKSFSNDFAVQSRLKATDLQNYGFKS